MSSNGDDDGHSNDSNGGSDGAGGDDECYKEAILRLSSTDFPPSPQRRRSRSSLRRPGPPTLGADSPGAESPRAARPPALSKRSAEAAGDAPADSGGETDASDEGVPPPLHRRALRSAAPPASASSSSSSGGEDDGVCRAAAPASPSSLSKADLAGGGGTASLELPPPLLEAVPTAAAVRIPSDEYYRINALHEQVTAVVVPDGGGDDGNGAVDAALAVADGDAGEEFYDAAGPSYEDVRQLQETVLALQEQLLRQNEIVATLRQSLVTLSSSTATAASSSAATLPSSSEESLPSSQESSGPPKPRGSTPQPAFSGKGGGHQVVISTRRLYLLLGIGFGVTIAVVLAIVLPLTLLTPNLTASSSGSDEHTSGEVPTPAPTLASYGFGQPTPDAGKWTTSKVPSSAVPPPTLVPYDPSPPTAVGTMPPTWFVSLPAVPTSAAPTNATDNNTAENAPVESPVNSTISGDEQPGPDIGGEQPVAGGGGVTPKTLIPTAAPASDGDEAPATLSPGAVAGISVAAVLLVGVATATVLLWHWYCDNRRSADDGAAPDRLLPLAGKPPTAAAASPLATPPPARWPASVTSVENGDDFDDDDGCDAGEGELATGAGSSSSARAVASVPALRARIERLQSRVANRSELAQRLAALLDEQRGQRHHVPDPPSGATIEARM